MQPETVLDPTRAARWPAWQALCVGVGLTGLLLVLYGPALRGPFVSDDFGYLTSPYTESLDPTSLSRMFDPAGDARLYTGNYAPVHLLLHALERSWFGPDPLGYHVVNVCVHALNALLLAALLLRSGVGRNAALLGGLVFAVHPANVEAVAWISQLKSTASLGFALLALLAFERRPAVATLCFGLGLLTKATAAFALPTAAAFVWVRGRSVEHAESTRRWSWIAAWCVVFGLFAVPQFSSFQEIGSAEVAAFDDPLTHWRSVVAIGARYLVMATSAYGVSAFAEPLPVESWRDVYLLGGLVVGTALAARVGFALRARREEAAWWIAAAAAFAPVSQIFPFLIPIADRYLYFILPGLIGGVALAAPELLRGPAARLGPAAGPLTLLAVGILAAGFASVSHARAALWQAETRLLVDAALHYPDGGTAHYLRARSAAAQGRRADAITSLRAASERGLDRYESFLADPALAPLRGDPSYRALIFELAGRRIARSNLGESTTQPELLAVARAHLARQESCDAERMLERALERGGPLDAQVETELVKLRETPAAGCAAAREEMRDRNPNP